MCMNSVTKLYTPLQFRSGRNGGDGFDMSCQITREQSARKLFRRQHLDSMAFLNFKYLKIVLLNLVT